jgi:hypothetical protein
MFSFRSHLFCRGHGDSEALGSSVGPSIGEVGAMARKSGGISWAAPASCVCFLEGASTRATSARAGAAATVVLAVERVVGVKAPVCGKKLIGITHAHIDGIGSMMYKHRAVYMCIRYTFRKHYT